MLNSVDQDTFEQMVENVSWNSALCGYTVQTGIPNNLYLLHRLILSINNCEVYMTINDIKS